MTEEIFRRITGGLGSTLRGENGGSISAYEGKGKVVSRFMDGRALFAFPIILTAVGNTPSGLFTLLETAAESCAECAGEIGDGWEICGTFLSAPPSFGSSEAAGQYSASCEITVTFYGGEAVL